jgi:hypothetical protein
MYVEYYIIPCYIIRAVVLKTKHNQKQARVM